jgi:hypothetical protein
MERQVIERLAMDLALGELNEDAATLFDAYLAEHPEARSWAQPMKTICTRTQEAIHAKTRDLGVPACRPAAQVHRSVPVRWVRLSRWAAVVAVSLGVGMGAGRWLESPTLTSPRIVALEGGRNTWQKDWYQVSNESGQGFWESKAAATLRSEPDRSSRRLESPPSLLEMLKQRQKERRHV